MSLTFLQINLHHCKAASAALLLHLAEVEVDVVLIQEPWILKNKVTGLNTKNYNIFVANTTGKLRSCILSKKSLNSFLISRFSDEDHTAISLESNKGLIRLCSAYMGHDKSGPPQDILRNLVEDSNSKKVELIIGCDANSHNITWGSSDTNDRGKSLFDYIMTCNLMICNVGNDPTFITKNRREVLDVTFATKGIVYQLHAWRVLGKHSFSDHRYIEFKLSLELPTKPIFVNYRKTTG